MDCCIRPGQVIILPRKGGGKQLLDKLATSKREYLHIKYRLEDVLDAFKEQDASTNNYPNDFRAYPFVAHVAEGQELKKARQFQQYPEVEVAVPNFFAFPAASPITMNDPELTNHIHLIHADAGDPSLGAGIRIAVLDTGVDDALFKDGALHPIQYDVDKPRQEKNVYTPYDKDGHGSVVATLIHRIAPAAQLHSIKVMEETGDLMGVIAGLYIAQQKISPHIFNLSLAIRCDLETCSNCGHHKRNPFLQWQVGQLFSSFLQNGSEFTRNPLLIAAAGNNPGELAVPARFPDMIAAGTYDPSTRSMAPFTYSKIQPDRFLLAPGGLNTDQQCIAKKMEYGFKRFYGTSFACAFVSGLSAAYMGRRNDQPLTRHDVLQCLAESCSKDFPDFTPAKHGLGLARYDPEVRKNITEGSLPTPVSYQTIETGLELQVLPLREGISEAAYRIWEREGRPGGQAERHWQQAKQELGIPNHILI